jgi:site-specific DNA-methyltransferase (adenine-specific)
MRKDPISIAENIDNMEFMARYPDKYFELAIVDPPYGIGESGGDKKRNRGYNRILQHSKKEWDNSIPPKEYFNELFRVSKEQIIWGANYMVEHLHASMGWIYWDKRIGGDFSDGELAFTSMKRSLRAYSYSHVGDTKGGHTRIHPTQKPVPLYKWLLNNYAKPGDKILDTHLGSGSSRIAAFDLGFDFYSCELDKEYYEKQEKRFSEFASQQRMF